MKKDMELIKEILLAVEDANTFTENLKVDIEGYNEKQINYHVMLLGEAGLIKTTYYSADDIPYWYPVRLTWEGHEFLDAIKNDNVWAKLKEKVKEKGSDIPFDVLKELAMQLTRAVFLE